MNIIWKIFKGLLMTLGAIWLVSLIIVFVAAYVTAPETTNGFPPNNFDEPIQVSQDM